MHGLMRMILLLGAMGLVASASTGQTVRKLREINPAGPSSPGDFVTDPITLVTYFSAVDGAGREPWITRGTSLTTGRLLDIHPTGSSGARGFTCVAPESPIRFCYFQAKDPAHGQEIWITDGSARNTRRLTDINPGNRHSLIQDMAVIGDRLFFSAYEPSKGQELYYADPDGTHGRVADIYPGSLGSYPEQLTPMGNTLYFRAKDRTIGEELWLVDATTLRVSSINLRMGRRPSTPEIVGVVSSIVEGQEWLFLAAYADNGWELFVVQGSTAKSIAKLPAQGFSFGRNRAATTPEGAYFVLGDGSLWAATPRGATQIDKNVLGVDSNEWSWETRYTRQSGSSFELRAIRGSTTRLLASLPGRPGWLSSTRDIVHFGCQDPANGEQLWVWAKETGAHRVTTINAGPSKGFNPVLQWDPSLRWLYLSGEGRSFDPEPWVVDLGAHAVVLRSGRGLAAGPSWPEYVPSTRPRLGTTFTSDLIGPANGIAAVVYGANALRATPIGNHSFWLVPPGLPIGATLLNASGQGVFALPLPNLQGLVGLELGSQSVFLKPPTGVSLSNEIRLRLDKR